MRFFRYLKFSTIVMGLIMISCLNAKAVEYFSRSTGSFTTGSRWSTVRTGGSLVAYPGATHTYTIQSGHNVSITAATSAAGINIESGGTLTASSFVLTVNGGWINNGTFVPGTSSVAFSASGTISGTSPLSFNGLSVGAATTLTVNNTVTVAGNVTITTPSGSTCGITISGTNSLAIAGTLNLPVSGNNNRSVAIGVGAGTLTVGGLFTMNAASSGSRLNYLNISTGVANLNGGITTGTTACRIVFSGSGVLNIAGTVSGGPPALTESTGTVNFTGASQNIWTENYYNLGVSGTGTKAMSGANIVSNVLNIASSTLNLGSATLSFSGTGTPLILAGTLTPGTSTVTFSGTGAQTVAGISYNNLSFSGTGVKTIANATTATIAGAFVVGAPLTMSGSGSASVNGAISGTGTITMGSGSLSVGSTFTSGTFSAGTGKVIYTSVTAQSVRNVNYYDLEFTGAGTKTIAAFIVNVGRNLIASSPTSMTTSGGANVAGSISGSGAISMAAGTVALEGDWTNSGTFTPGTGTVHYDGTNQSVAGLTYNNLQTSVAGTKSVAGNVTVNSVLTITSPSIFNVGTHTVTLPFTGVPLVIGGTITGTGTILYSGAGAQTIAATSYPNLQFSGAGVKTIAAGTPVDIDGNWIVGSATSMTTTGSANVAGDISGAGAITMAAGTINLAGTWSNSGTFTRGTGTVAYNGATQAVKDLVYYNLQILNGGVKTLLGTTSVANILTINSSNLDLATNTLNLTGPGTPLVVSGTFTCSTSTVNFSNAASSTIPALNYYILNTTGGPRTFANTGTIGIAGLFTPGAGLITVTGSTVHFNGGAQTIPAFTFNDVVFSGGDKTIQSAVTVKNVEIQTGPTLNINPPGILTIN